MPTNIVDNDLPPIAYAKNLKDPPKVAAGPVVEESVVMPTHIACVALFDIGHDRLADESEDEDAEQQQRYENPSLFAFKYGKDYIPTIGHKIESPNTPSTTSLTPSLPVDYAACTKKSKTQPVYTDQCCLCPSVSTYSPRSGNSTTTSVGGGIASSESNASRGGSTTINMNPSLPTGGEDSILWQRMDAWEVCCSDTLVRVVEDQWKR